MDLFIGTSYEPIRFYERQPNGFFEAKFGIDNPLDIAGSISTAALQLVDIDGDLDLDAFIGTSSGIMLRFHENDGNPNNSSFLADNQTQQLVIDFNAYPGFHDYTKPAIVDIDKDGDLDAYFKFGSNAYFFKNDAGSYLFTSKLLANYRPGFKMADIDHDGDPDMIIGGTFNNSFRLLTNDAGVFTEQFGASNPFGVTYDNDETLPSFIDFDNDGDLDILMGVKYDDYMRFFTNDNVPPTVNLNPAPLVFFENSVAISLDNGLSITDDNANMVAGTLTITNFNPVEDIISYTPINGITGVITGNTITFSGSVSQAAWAAALQNVTFQNTSEDPDPTPRIMNFKVRDSDFTNSTFFTRTITVVPVNDPPSITSTAGTTAAEASLYTYTASVVDPDDVNNGTDLSWSLSNEPTGMIVSSTGVVTWTPSGVTTSGAVTLTVQDGGENGAAPDTEVFTIAVTSVNDPPSITTSITTLDYNAGAGAVVIETAFLNIWKRYSAGLPVENIVI